MEKPAPAPAKNPGSDRLRQPPTLVYRLRYSFEHTLGLMLQFCFSCIVFPCCCRQLQLWELHKVQEQYHRGLHRECGRALAVRQISLLSTQATGEIIQDYWLNHSRQPRESGILTYLGYLYCSSDVGPLVP